MWSPANPTASATLDFGELDAIEITVVNDEEGPKVVSAIELVSPANKDRPAHRQAFAVKCASYLQDGISVMIVDVVTERHANLHAGLLEFLKVDVITPAQGIDDLYAAAYRPAAGPDEVRVEIWAELLSLGLPLPILPLWLTADHALPLNLEDTYKAACAARRIEMT